MNGGIAARLRLAAALVAFTFASACSGPPPAQAPKTPADVNEPSANSPVGFLPGAIYRGLPDYSMTGAFLRAGGYPGPFSAERAFQTMIGTTAEQEQRKVLTKLYGASAVTSFFRTYSNVLAQFAAVANAQSFLIPKSKLAGTALAVRLIRSGVEPGGAFSTGYLLDHLMLHETALKILSDVRHNGAFGQASLDNFNRVGNMFHFNLARGLGVSGVELATSQWTTTAGMHAIPDARGSMQFEYLGTGSKSGNESAARLVTVQPGRTYSFSAFVQADAVTAGGFFLMIASADGTRSYATFFHSAAKPQRRSTPWWTCPSNVNRALILMQVTGATVPAGSRVVFSAPILQTRGLAPLAL